MSNIWVAYHDSVLYGEDVKLLQPKQQEAKEPIKSNTNTSTRETKLNKLNKPAVALQKNTTTAANPITSKITKNIPSNTQKSNVSTKTTIAKQTRAPSSAPQTATSFLTNEDADIMYDLKNMLQSTKNFVPQELNSHPSAQFKPGSVPDRPSRRDTIIYAKT